MNASIAQLLENLLNISVNLAPQQVSTGPNDIRLKQARICYDHLAGELGVEIYDALKQQAFIIYNGSETLLTDLGKEFFSSIGFDFSQIKKSKRLFVNLV